MIQGFSLTFLILAGLIFTAEKIGYQATYQVASGAIVVMSSVIATTFFWLWRIRTTPLALGMSFSWAGGALVLSWWWRLAADAGSAAISESIALLLFVAIYTTGAALHFSVIARSFDLPRMTPVALPFTAYVLSGCATFLA